jgi:hypothetical protein
LLRKFFAPHNKKPGRGGGSAGNILSTIAGLPFLWIALAAAELTFGGRALGLATPLTRIYAVTVRAPWLMPYQGNFTWMIPVSLLVLSVPAYALSVLIEWAVLLPLFKMDRRGGYCVRWHL